MHAAAELFYCMVDRERREWARGRVGMGRKIWYQVYFSRAGSL